MHIDKFEEAIMNCRFCFMCRHLSAIGNVRFTEVDTPRIRAAMLYGLRTGTNSFDDEDFVDALYRQDLSACCVRHCVNHYDENGLALAARADVVEAGKAPEAVKRLAAKLVRSIGWKAEGPSSAKATEGKAGDVAWFLDGTTAADKAAVAAAKKLFAAAKASPKIITGGCIGKALKVLGFRRAALTAMDEFAAFLEKEGVKTLVVSNPAAVNALKQDYPEFGVKLPCEVKSMAGFILQAKLKFSKPAGEVYALADDFIRNYQGCACMDKLLAALKATCKPFGTNDEETYCCGEGAVVLDKLHPELVKALAEYVAARADDPKKDRFVVASAYVKKALAKYGRLNVVTLEELAASCL
ncbi:MAG: (Fe-S)-binding protein [Kiritimatiellae bacterium]|nr:(Fe-S)-binding protein [Kiritimatiellia bacterium]